MAFTIIYSIQSHYYIKVELERSRELFAPTTHGFSFSKRRKWSQCCTGGTFLDFRYFLCADLHSRKENLSTCALDAGNPNAQVETQ